MNNVIYLNKSEKAFEIYPWSYQLLWVWLIIWQCSLHITLTNFIDSWWLRVLAWIKFTVLQQCLLYESSSKFWVQCIMKNRVQTKESLPLFLPLTTPLLLAITGLALSLINHFSPSQFIFAQRSHQISSVLVLPFTGTTTNC
jgi:hypothetical protein